MCLQGDQQDGLRKATPRKKIIAGGDCTTRSPWKVALQIETRVHSEASAAGEDAPPGPPVWRRPPHFHLLRDGTSRCNLHVFLS